jgi:hypothetical protein
MWRVQRLDQINAFKRANLFEFKSLALKIQSEQIGPFKTAIRSEVRRGHRGGCAIQQLHAKVGLPNAIKVGDDSPLILPVSINNQHLNSVDRDDADVSCPYAVLPAGNSIGHQRLPSRSAFFPLVVGELLNVGTVVPHHENRRRVAAHPYKRPRP